MLLVYGALVVGGIETFFVRLMKERYRIGLKTKLLLTQPEIKSNPKLLAEARSYGEVYFIQDFFKLSFSLINSIPKAFYPLLPTKLALTKELFKDVEQIHVSDAFSAVIAFFLFKKVSLNLPITIGLYHSMEFLWGPDDLPYFEKINRKFVFEWLPIENVIVFNESFITMYKKSGVDLNAANFFPIGVIEEIGESELTPISIEKGKLKIVSVGRLVDFKKYNRWMIELIPSLNDVGLNIEYHIFGNGPLESELRELAKTLDVERSVVFHGLLEYTCFNKTVVNYDLFIGSGTAIVQASSLGVPAIIGIEDEPNALTYGYFSDISGFSYNEDNLFDKIPVITKLKDFNCMDDFERIELQRKHRQKASHFSMSVCVQNFNAINPSLISLEITKFPIIRYCSSLLINVIAAKFIKVHPLNFKYTKKQG